MVMEIFEKNLEVLEKYYPGMNRLIEKAKEDLVSKLEVIEEVSYTGEKILKIKKNEKTLFLNGKRDTTEPAQMWVKTLGKLERNAPVLLVGVGNPSYLKELVEQTDNRIAVIVYEPSLQIFLKFLEMVDIEKWMEKHLIVFWIDSLEDMDGAHIKEVLAKILTYEMLEYSKTFVLPNYEKLFPDKVVEFVKICKDIAFSELMLFNTRNAFSVVMVKNLFSNARYLCDGYKTTQIPQVIPQDMPGIVVAAGPSLNKNIHELKKAKGKAFIVAVDTAVKPLLQAGIMPDMFAIIDGLKPLELVQREEARNIPLLTMLNAASEVLEYHTGMKIFYNQGYQFAERIFLKSGHPIGDVPGGGSVATHVFSFLCKIGLKTIILVGQDLAFTGNKSHADGTFQQIMEEVDTSNFIMVEGDYEEMVPTRPDFKAYLDWYNWVVEGYKNRYKDFRVINATEGGAKINNTEIMTLKEAIEQECANREEMDIQKCLKKLPPMLDEDKRIWTVEYLKSIPEKCTLLREEAREIRKLYLKIDKICNRRKIEKKEYESILKKLNKRIEKIEDSSMYQLVEISMNNAAYILRGEQFLSEDSLQAEGKEIARKGILYMDNVMKAAESFKEYAEEIFGEKFAKEFGIRKDCK